MSKSYWIAYFQRRRQLKFFQVRLEKVFLYDDTHKYKNETLNNKIIPL